MAPTMVAIGSAQPFVSVTVTSRRGGWRRRRTREPAAEEARSSYLYLPDSGLNNTGSYPWLPIIFLLRPMCTSQRVMMLADCKSNAIASNPCQASRSAGRLHLSLALHELEAAVSCRLDHTLQIAARSRLAHSCALLHRLDTRVLTRGKHQKLRARHYRFI